MTNHLKTIKTKLLADTIAVPVTLQSEYYKSLDGLRAIAILLVIFAHFGINNFLLRFNLKINGTIGVHIFFVLSGFLITTVLLKKKLKHGRISLSDFYIRRLLRIVPLAYLFLLVLIIISAAYRPMSSKMDFLYAFLFLKNLPVKNQPFTAQLWSLSVEMQFYMVIPFLLFPKINRFFILAILLVVAVPLLSILCTNYPAMLTQSSRWAISLKIANYSFWKGPVILLIGAMAAFLSFKGIIKLKWGAPYYFLSFFLLIAAILISTPNFCLYNKYLSEYLSAMMIAGVILLNIGSENFLSKILSNPILIKIGIWSYSLYIWQELFIGRFFWLPWLRWLNNYPVLVILLIKLIILFPMAYASYHLVETPFLKWKKKFS